jgi:hypothetical protein
LQRLGRAQRNRAGAASLEGEHGFAAAF